MSMTPKEALKRLCNHIPVGVINGMSYGSPKEDLEAKYTLSLLVNCFGDIPDTIKLSELKKRINNEILTFGCYYRTDKKHNSAIIIMKGSNEEIVAIKDGKIASLDGYVLGISKQTKWLYLLWLNETEIVIGKEVKK